MASHLNVKYKSLKRWVYLGFKTQKTSNRQDKVLLEKLLLWSEESDEKILKKDFIKLAISLSTKINFKASKGWLANLPLNLKQRII